MEGRWRGGCAQNNEQQVKGIPKGICSIFVFCFFLDRTCKTESYLAFSADKLLHLLLLFSLCKCAAELKHAAHCRSSLCRITVGPACDRVTDAAAVVSPSGRRLLWGFILQGSEDVQHAVFRNLQIKRRSSQCAQSVYETVRLQGLSCLLHSFNKLKNGPKGKVCV